MLLLLFSHVWLFVTPWTVTHQAPLFMGFPGKNTGVGCHFLPQRIFPTTHDWIHVSCIDRWIFLPLNHQESLGLHKVTIKDKIIWKLWVLSITSIFNIFRLYMVIIKDIILRIKVIFKTHHFQIILLLLTFYCYLCSWDYLCNVYIW